MLTQNLRAKNILAGCCFDSSQHVMMSKLFWLCLFVFVALFGSSQAMKFEKGEFDIAGNSMPIEMMEVGRFLAI